MKYKYDLILQYNDYELGVNEVLDKINDDVQEYGAFINPFTFDGAYVVCLVNVPKDTDKVLKIVFEIIEKVGLDYIFQDEPFVDMNGENPAYLLNIKL